jgi:3-oxoacyl-[acyl-carrier-protein] synthase II
MKVYVTGMGALTSLGNDVDTFFAGLKRGDTGVKAFPEWRKYNGLHSYVGAPVPEYDVMKIPRQVRRSMSRMSEMAALATYQALGHADLQPGPQLNSPRVLIMMGSTSGSPWTFEAYFKKLLERGGPEGQLSTSFFKVMNHSVAANVAASIDFNGALLSPSCACATSTQAMIVGWELIKAGLYDIVITGGADELHYMSTSIFDIVMAASRGYNDTPEEASRPFDSKRDGLVVSEGAGVVILESEESVNRRKARPLAEMRGGAYLCDGSHMSQSSAETMQRVMHESLRRAGMTAQEVDYVNAHATATIHGDVEEAKAINAVFGEGMATSSIKGHLGHSLAACGAIEAIACIKMMEESVLIPTRNLKQVASDCAPLRYIQELTPAKIQSTLSNNFAFGGMNTCLLLSAVNNS